MSQETGSKASIPTATGSPRTRLVIRDPLGLLTASSKGTISREMSRLASQALGPFARS